MLLRMLRASCASNALAPGHCALGNWSDDVSANLRLLPWTVSDADVRVGQNVRGSRKVQTRNALETTGGDNHLGDLDRTANDTAARSTHWTVQVHAPIKNCEVGE